ncbi:MAG: hypothetical protein LUH58_06255 [Lachnospiraceae bacterium]|nr:hypothetical protein [Lachnospiraceae bacterium]
MQTTLYAVETIDQAGDLSEPTTKEHEIVVEIPEAFHPTIVHDRIQVEYDEGCFPLDELLVIRGGFPALALWDRDTYKEIDYPLHIVSDRVVRKAG